MGKFRDLYEKLEDCWTGCGWTELRQSDVYLGEDLGEESKEVVEIDLSDESPGTANDNASRLRRDADEEEEETTKNVALMRARAVLWDEAQEYLKTCEEDAEEAQKYGEQAAEAADKGELDEAMDMIKEACGTEADYGDDPVWGQLREAIEAAIKKRDGVEDGNGVMDNPCTK